MRRWHYTSRVILIYIYVIKKKKTILYSTNLQTNFFRVELPKMDRHTEDKWLHHGSKHHKDNQSKKSDIAFNNSFIVSIKCFPQQLTEVA